MWIEILEMIIKLVESGIMKQEEARCFIRSHSDKIPFFIAEYLLAENDYSLLK